ncbi:hypothetical protein JCM10908_004591 [Rhodotorula pacifica]|uniref:uncharacterized protein n=1 Tax=Rhodotorula pacifica TaxID=1495444 RepID=UPI00317C016F
MSTRTTISIPPATSVKGQGRYMLRGSNDFSTLSTKRSPSPTTDLVRNESASAQEQTSSYTPIRRLSTAAPLKASISGPSRWSNRLDSVYAVYAEMYPEMDEAEADEGDSGFTSPEDQRGKAVSSYLPPVPHSRQSSRPENTLPWDERGATGLYGGGGRGADDQETGWARNFVLVPPPPVSGVEEDLRFEEEEGSTDDTPTPLASPVPPEASRVARAGSPVSSMSGHLSDTAHSASSIRRAREQAELTTESEAPSHAEPEVKFERDAAPIHTVDIGQIKKQHARPTMPTPSEPMLSPKNAIKARPNLPRTPILKWRSRSKKAPTISTPILPPGFVESLGMETFALQPGVKPPLPAARRPLEGKTVEVLPIAPVARTLTPPRTPSIKRDLARNPKLSPVGFGRESVTAETTELPPPPPLVAVESDEASRGQRVQALSWSDSSISFEAAPSTLEKSWDRSHSRTESSATSSSGFRDPWATSSSSAHSHSDASMPSKSSWAPRYDPFDAAPAPPPQRFREDSVASQYSDSDAPSPISPQGPTFLRQTQPLSVVRRGENTYSFASLSPSMCGPDDTVSWSFPAPVAPQNSAGPDLAGFRNPFST